MKSEINDGKHMMEKMRELALANPEKITIVETSVDPNIQIEFFEALKKLEKKSNYNNSFDEVRQELENPEVSVKRKKEIIASLVVIGEVESFRIIESYLEKAKKELKTWTFLACQQAKMFLESKLLEETKIYIASGMGGKDHRLRYSFAIYTDNDSFSKYQTDIVKGELQYFFKKEDCILEQIYFDGKFAIATCLVPVFVDLVNLLQKVLDEINQYGNFLSPNVFITNEKKINIKELEKIIDNPSGS